MGGVKRLTMELSLTRAAQVQGGVYQVAGDMDEMTRT